MAPPDVARPRPRGQKSTGDWCGGGFAHEAFLFGDPAALSARCVPFVVDGLAADQPVVVVASEATRELLRDELGPDVRRLAAFEPAESWWRGGHATLTAYERSMRPLIDAGEPWRLVGEPIWLADPGGREWSRFESVANECFAQLPYYSLCLHDRRVLDDETLDEALRTHPTVWDGERPVPSPTYVRPAQFLRSVEPAWTDPPAVATALAVATPRHARTLVREAAVGAGFDRGRTDDLVLVAHELVVNALAVSSDVTVTTWTEDAALVCQVADRGPGFEVGLGGYQPLRDSLEGGRGLWLLRSLSDDATIRSRPDGTVARAYFHLDGR